MATYQINVNERTSAGKSNLAMLSAVPETVSFTKVAPVTKAEKHSPLYCQLQSAFRDVKLMVDGKMREKTLDEFLAELPVNPDSAEKSRFSASDFISRWRGCVKSMENVSDEELDRRNK